MGMFRKWALDWWFRGHRALSITGMVADAQVRWAGKSSRFKNVWQGGGRPELSQKKMQVLMETVKRFLHLHQVSVDHREVDGVDETQQVAQLSGLCFRGEGVSLRAERPMAGWKKAYCDPLSTSIPWRWPCGIQDEHFAMSPLWRRHLYARNFYK